MQIKEKEKVRKMEKMTKKDYFNMIANAMADNADVVAFCEKEIAALDAKALKAKERAAKKAAEGDALMEAIAEVLDETPKTLAEIAALVGEDVTPNKVSPRAKKLVEAGRAVKTEVAKPEGKGRLVAYTAA